LCLVGVLAGCEAGSRSPVGEKKLALLRRFGRSGRTPRMTTRDIFAVSMRSSSNAASLPGVFAHGLGSDIIAIDGKTLRRPIRTLAQGADPHDLSLEARQNSSGQAKWRTSPTNTAIPQLLDLLTIEGAT